MMTLFAAADRRKAKAGLLLLASLVAGGCQSARDFARGHVGARSEAVEHLPDDAVARGALLFAFGDYGGLDTDAMETVATPWRLTSAALVLAQSPEDVSQAALRRILARYGFLQPASLENWPGGASEAPSAGPALGVLTATGRRSLPPLELQIGNLGCAACHAGPVYDAQGRADPDRAWLGAPNPSLNLEAYTQALYAALKQGVRTPDRLIATARALYPDMTDREIATLRDHVLPRVRSRLARLAAEGDRPLPFSNGLPGATNGVAALKLQHGLLEGDAEVLVRERGFTSIPHLSDRAWRSALLWDGVYAPPGEARFRPLGTADLTADHRDALAAVTAYFTVPSMGVSQDRAWRSRADAQAAWVFLETVRPQPFPGRIDATRAAAGADVYRRVCAACHGDYAETPGGPRLIRFPNWAGDVGTDKARAEAITEALAARINASPFGAAIQASPTGVYAAPPLTGLWQSAPYLHNGSVPSLAALLGLESRPERFLIGGHDLDLERVGPVYRDGRMPYAEAVQVDTRLRGLGRHGHEAPFADLTREDRLNLLEYLKRL